jgi:glycogen(starch) synthase
MISGNLHILMTADTVGGVWTHTLELARTLAPHGVHISLATMGAAPSEEQRRVARRLQNVSLLESRFALEWMDDPWRHVDAAGDWLLQLGAELRPDLVHLNGYAHAALDWSMPVVAVAHSCILSWWRAVKGEPHPARLDEYQRRTQAGLRGADLVVAPSAAMLAALQEHYAFSTPTLVIPNGFDGVDLPPRKKEPLIISAGRLWDEGKNIALLERIAPQLNWPTLVAGDAGRRAPQNARNIRFAGNLSSKAIATEFSRASIYASPTRYEPFGLCVLEAALAGCALVLSDLPSLRENWDSAAVFVSPDDDRAWIASLNALAADENKRAELSDAAFARAQYFSGEHMAAAYLHAYASLAPVREPHRPQRSEFGSVSAAPEFSALA